MAPPGESPQSEHRRLIVALRHARDALQLTQKEVADALDWSASKLTRIERGLVGISVTDLKALLSLYRVTEDDEVDRMVAMARASKQAAWWQNYREVIPQDFFTFIGLEASAIRISQYQGVLVPGLLQSPEYIKALLRSGDDTPGQQRRGLEVRLRRQELISDDGPEFFFILDESTLRRAVGDSAVMREQLLKLKEVADHPRVSIRIMPFSAGVLRGQKNSFEVLRLSEEPDDYALIIDQGYKDQLMQVPNDETRTYVALFSKLEGKALSEDETRYMLDERLKEVEKD